MRTSLPIGTRARLPLAFLIGASVSLCLSACDNQPKYTWPGCCPVSSFRGCCSSEPLQAGGLTGGAACDSPERTIPACAEFPIRESYVGVCGDCGACTVLYEAKSEEPCNCTPLEDGCEPICVVPGAPALPDACASVTTSFDGPAICPAAAPPVTYVVSEITVNPDPTVGFDLDGTEQSSCVGGDRVGPDDSRGVDNSLAYADDYILFDRDIAYLNGRVLEQVCFGGATLALEVYPNPEEGCATVSVLSSGEVIASSSLRLDGACLHGAIGRFDLPLPDQDAPLDNVKLTATLDHAGFANMTLGATASPYSSKRIFEVLGYSLAYEHYLDIRADLDTGGKRCDAMSLTLDVAGATAVR